MASSLVGCLVWPTSLLGRRRVLESNMEPSLPQMVSEIDEQSYDLDQDALSSGTPEVFHHLDSGLIDCKDGALPKSVCRYTCVDSYVENKFHLS